MIRWLDDMVIRCHQRQKLPNFPKFSKNCQRLPKHGEKLLKAVKAWQKLQKNCKKLPKDTKSSQTMSKLAKIKKNSKEKTNDGKICQKLLEGGKKNVKSWQKTAKNTKSSWKDDKKFITSWHLTLRDIWNFITCWQVDKLTSSTLWRVDMLTSYQEFRIIWFWAPKFETTTYSLTYLLTRVKSRDASASKKTTEMVGDGTP